jgi:hypothetical protein
VEDAIVSAESITEPQRQGGLTPKPLDAEAYATAHRGDDHGTRGFPSGIHL